MTDRTIQPELKKVESVNIQKEESTDLPNGIPMFTINGGVQDVLKIDLMINAGGIHSDHKLVAPLTSLMLNEGSTNYNAKQIAENFDSYGAHFNPKAEKDCSFASLVTLNKHLDKTLPYFSEVVTESVFPEKEFEVLLQRRKQNFLVDKEKTSFLARNEFFKQLFGENHPYGRPSTEELYDSVSRDNVAEFFDRKYHSGNFSLIVSGKVSDKEKNLIADTFGSLPIMLTGKTQHPEINTHPGIYNIKKENAVQTSIRLGFKAINKYHYDYPALKILVTLLGGFFGSRLMKNIREEKGYTYGVHAMLVSLHETGYVAVASDVKSEFATQAVNEILNEMYKLKTEMVNDDELNIVKNYMMGEMLQMFDGPFSSSDTFIASQQFGFGFSYYERLIDEILTIDSTKIQRLANTYFDSDSLVIVKAGNFK